MSYLRYFCLLVHSGVQHILCCALGLLDFSSCVPYISSFSGFSFFIALSVTFYLKTIPFTPTEISKNLKLRFLHNNDVRFVFTSSCL